MPIYRLLQGGQFGPQEIDQMVRAYEEALKMIGLTDRSSPIAEAIARRVISAYQSGETDQHRMAQKAANGVEARPW
jgi:hypothetical protein